MVDNLTNKTHSKRNKSKWPLIGKLMLSINSISLLIIIGLSGSIAIKMVRDTERMVISEMEVLAKSISLTSAEYVWSLNNEALKLITTQLLENVSIESVAILDAKNAVIVKSKRGEIDLESAHEKQSSLNQGDSRKIKSPLLYGKENENIGFVEFEYNLDKVVSIRNEIVKIALMGAAIAQFSLGIFLYFVLRGITNRISLITEALRGVTQKNQASADNLWREAKEISSATNKQSESIRSTVGTLERISLMVASTADGVQKSSLKARESLAIANNGQVVVQEVMRSMEEIEKSNVGIMDAIKKSNERVSGIIGVINEISEKTEIINDIVFQTKLLSFNASVEAARAGEHGKGFAVVAEEVGSLAQMSGNASNEISNILQSSINTVETIIKDTDQSIQRIIFHANSKVENGMETGKRCGKVFEAIVANAETVTTMLQDVYDASEKQVAGVKIIADELTMLDSATVSNSNTVQRSFFNSKNLSQQSSELKETVVELEVEIFGKQRAQINGIAEKQMTTALEVDESSPAH